MEFRNDGFCYDANGNEVGYHGIHKKSKNKRTSNSWLLYLIFSIILYEFYKNYFLPGLKTFKGQLNNYSKLFNLSVPGIYWVVVITITYFLFKTIAKKKKTLENN